MNRRGFITGVVGFLAAPAIVRASSIMPISVMHTDAPLVVCTERFLFQYSDARGLWGTVIDTTWPAEADSLHAPMIARLSDAALPS